MAADLFERDQELAALGAMLDAIVDERGAGRGHIAVISGEAGIGKTALVERFLARVRARIRPSIRPLWASCEALFTPRPLGSLYDIAQQTTSVLRALLDGEAGRAALFVDHPEEIRSTRR